MMTSSTILSSYYETDDYEEFNMTFGNKAFYMKILLPKMASSSNKPIFLEPEQMNTSNKTYETVELKVHLPKFKIKSNLSLRKILEKKAIIDPSQDVLLTMFTSPESGELKMNQSSSFEIDETGTKVAAATEVSNVNTVPLFPYHEIFVNCPFYFFIKEVSTGACILSGRIADL